MWRCMCSHVRRLHAPGLPARQGLVVLVHGLLRPVDWTCSNLLWRSDGSLGRSNAHRPQLSRSMPIHALPGDWRGAGAASQRQPHTLLLLHAYHC